MKLVYTVTALRQIDESLTSIEERNPQGARRVEKRIKAMLDMVALFPMSGHKTNEPGQRRIVVSPYPYAIFYRLREGVLIIQRIRHTSRLSET